LLRTAPPRAAPSTPEQEVERRILGAGLRFTALAVAFQSVVHLVNLLVFDLQIDFFNAESDTSFFAYTSSVATLACGAMVLLLARPRRVVRVGLALLAAAIVMEILGIVVVSLGYKPPALRAAGHARGGHRARRVDGDRRGARGRGAGRFRQPGSRRSARAVHHRTRPVRWRTVASVLSTLQQHRTFAAAA